jgi:hypothetical protein
VGIVRDVDQFAETNESSDVPDRICAAIIATQMVHAQGTESSLQELISLDPGEGNILRFPGLKSVTGPGAGWSGNGTVEMVHESLAIIR